MSRFKGVFDARQHIPEEPLDVPKLESQPKVAKLGGKASSLPVPPIENESKKIGRPPGKRSNPEYQSVTTFLHRQTYLDVQKALIGSTEDFGDVVDQLLKEWLKRQV